MEVAMLQNLAIACVLGLLVGLQRERAASSIAGFRTFALITMLGALCAMLGDAWVLAAGFVALATAVVIGNVYAARGAPKPGEPAESPGITTEVTVFVMFAIGAMVHLGDTRVAIAAGVVVAVLLNAKPFLHGLAARTSDEDVRAILQFAVVSCVVLPMLPDRQMGPLQAFNPYHIWLMVTLVVGMSLAGYLGYKALWASQESRATGLRNNLRESWPLIAGLLGGLVSSTATTAAYSRLTRGTRPPSSVVLVLVLASTVVFVRVLVEIAAVAPGSYPQMAPPIAAMLGCSALAAISVYMFDQDSPSRWLSPDNPTQLKSALFFGFIYALVLLTTALAKHWLGDAGLLVVAGVSGLTDMDAITLSVSRMAAMDVIDERSAWRAIVVASIANLLFKSVLIGVLGGPGLLRRTMPLLGAVALTGVGMLVVW
jgi:uncharacterized membrane protein (DUF4010 family)